MTDPHHCDAQLELHMTIYVSLVVAMCVGLLAWVLF